MATVVAAMTIVQLELYCDCSAEVATVNTCHDEAAACMHFALRARPEHERGFLLFDDRRTGQPRADGQPVAVVHIGCDKAAGVREIDLPAPFTRFGY